MPYSPYTDPDLSIAEIAADFTAARREIEKRVAEEAAAEALKGWEPAEEPAPVEEPVTDPLLLRLDRIEVQVVKLIEMFAAVMVLLAKPQEIVLQQPPPRSVTKRVNRDGEGRIESVEEVEEHPML